MEHLFTVFIYEKDEYVADESIILCSIPPKFNCYRLIDMKLNYIPTHIALDRNNFIRNIKQSEFKKLKEQHE